MNSVDKHGNSVARQAMDITDEMLQAAVRKAIEAGLLPRNAGRDDAHGSKELMRLIVAAAMSANRPNELPGGASSYRRYPTRTTFPAASDAKRAISTYACS